MNRVQCVSMFQCTPRLTGVIGERTDIWGSGATEVSEIRIARQ